MDPDTGTPACHLLLGAWAAKDGTGTVCNGTARQARGREFSQSDATFLKPGYCLSARLRLPAPTEFLLSRFSLFFEKGKCIQPDWSAPSEELLPPVFRVCFQQRADALKWRPEFGEALPSKLQEGQWKASLSRQNCSVPVLHLKMCTGWIFRWLFLAHCEQLQHTSKLKSSGTAQYCGIRLLSQNGLPLSNASPSAAMCTLELNEVRHRTMNYLDWGKTWWC